MIMVSLHDHEGDPMMMGRDDHGESVNLGGNQRGMMRQCARQTFGVEGMLIVRSRVLVLACCEEGFRTHGLHPLCQLLVGHLRDISSRRINDNVLFGNEIRREKVL